MLIILKWVNMERKVKLYGKELKEALIKSRFDEEKKCLLSVREAIRVDKYDLKIPISNWNWWCKVKPEVVNAEPYAGQAIDDKLIYKYVKENKLIPSNITFKEFIGNRNNNKIDENTVIRKICEKLNWISPKNIFDYSATIIALENVYSEETVERVRQEVIKELLSK